MKTYQVSSSSALSYRASDGRLQKWWVGDTMIKTSSITDNSFKPLYMYESFSEVIAYKLFTELGIHNALKYSLCNIIIDMNAQTIGCGCRSFMTSDSEYYDIGKLLQLGILTDPSYAGIITQLSPYIKSIQKYLDTILILDALILNTDRHLGNIGITRSKITNTFSLPPIFDNGDSLFGGKHVDGEVWADDLLGYAKSRPFHSNFDIQLKLVSAPLKVDTLKVPRTLAYISTLQKYGLTRERCTFIKELINSRLRYLHNSGYIQL